MTYHDSTYLYYSSAEQYCALPSAVSAQPISVKVEDSYNVANTDNTGILPNISDHSHYLPHQYLAPYFCFVGSQDTANVTPENSSTTAFSTQVSDHSFQQPSDSHFPGIALPPPLLAAYNNGNNSTFTGLAELLPGAGLNGYFVPEMDGPVQNVNKASNVLPERLDAHTGIDTNANDDELAERLQAAVHVSTGGSSGVGAAGQSINVLPSVPDERMGSHDRLAEPLPAAYHVNVDSCSRLDVPGHSVGEVNTEKVRKRSSRACDQCRQVKCKCNWSRPQEPCENCTVLGVKCTFLGPSKKRGPAKGYIDTMEAHLHQIEALVRIMLASASRDSRLKTLFEDLSEDALAREIIARVKTSSYGCKDRMHASGSAASIAPSLKSLHPSNEWQDAVTAHLNVKASQRNTLIEDQEQWQN